MRRARSRRAGWGSDEGTPWRADRRRGQRAGGVGQPGRDGADEHTRNNEARTHARTHSTLVEASGAGWLVLAVEVCVWCAEWCGGARCVVGRSRSLARACGAVRRVLAFGFTRMRDATGPADHSRTQTHAEPTLTNGHVDHTTGTRTVSTVRMVATLDWDGVAGVVCVCSNPKRQITHGKGRLRSAF
jgi:hypothetical protein